jgi:ribosomal protein L11 methyltransferase
MPDARIKSLLMSRLAISSSRLTFGDLVRAAREDLGADRRAVAAAIKSLLADGSVAYVQQLGTTFLEVSYRYGRRISPRICLVPETAPVRRDLEAGLVGLRLSAGAAFGVGDHPTTRLALQAIDRLFQKPWVNRSPRVLDMGTGTGILAIAAVLLGADSALGLDVDPIALWEAAQNARQNGVEDRFTILDAAIEDLEAPFDLILANLRLPTLLHLGLEFARLLDAEGRAVVTGLRPEERGALQGSYEALGMELIWADCAQNWTVLVFGAQPGRDKTGNSVEDAS